MKVVVYCSSAAGVDPEVTSAAERLGHWIAVNAHQLVYGGVNAGLMHDVAAAVKKNGGKVIGVIPEIFTARADELCDEVITVPDLAVRKSRMIELGDIFVVLPGGLGTIDEWISTLSHFVVAERVDPSAGRPVVVLNHNGVFDSTLQQLRSTTQSVYGGGRTICRSLVAQNADQLIARLQSL